MERSCGAALRQDDHRRGRLLRQLGAPRDRAAHRGAAVEEGRLRDWCAHCAWATDDLPDALPGVRLRLDRIPRRGGLTFGLHRRQDARVARIEFDLDVTAPSRAPGVERGRHPAGWALGRESAENHTPKTRFPGWCGSLPLLTSRT